jgi:hypothetical protein
MAARYRQMPVGKDESPLERLKSPLERLKARWKG